MPFAEKKKENSNQRNKCFCWNNKDETNDEQSGRLISLHLRELVPDEFNSIISGRDITNNGKTPPTDTFGERILSGNRDTKFLCTYV